jgi:hypothetical protein
MGLTLNEMWWKKGGIVDWGGAVECQIRSRTEVPARIRSILGACCSDQAMPKVGRLVRARPCWLEVACGSSGRGREPSSWLLLKFH